MIAAARCFAAGGAVTDARERRPRPVELASFEGIVSKDTDWRPLGRAPVRAAAVS